MKILLTRSLVALASLSIILSLALGAQQEKAQKQKKKKRQLQLQEQPQQGQPSEQEMMQRWMQYMTPGPEHQLLAERAGNWTFTMKIWQAPNAPAVESTGTSKCDMIHGGRYLRDETKGSYMNMPFEGFALTGYDNMNKKYVSVWIDNMGTGLMTSEGQYDEASKTFTYTADAPDVIAGMNKKIRFAERMVDDNTIVMEMYDKTPDGQEFKMMELTYKRAQ